MSIESIDATGLPRPARDIEAAIRFIKADMLASFTRMGAGDTGPAAIHYVTILDALKELLARRERDGQ
jgi:hypothetical protein